jgi:hypothetical protein
MTTGAAPEQACVHVGPLSPGMLIAGWPQGCGCTGGRRPGWRVVTGTLLAADDRASAGRLETADVIVASAGAERTGPREQLCRYPGCAVAVAWAGSAECSVATRSGVLPSVAISGQQGAGGALACAAFAHGWIVAGLPLALLSPACLTVNLGAAGLSAVASWPGSVRPLFFRFGYRPGSGDDPCLLSPGSPP